MIKYKILHITDLHFRHNGRLFYSTGKKLNNGLILNGHNVLNISDRDITSNKRNIFDIGSKKFLFDQIQKNIENFRPDVKDRLGINYEDLKRVNPRIILGSISGFGQDGPYGKRPGFDQIAQGMGGLMSITGAPGEGPMRVGIPVADLTAGLFFAMRIQTTLIKKEKLT